MGDSNDPALEYFSRCIYRIEIECCLGRIRTLTGGTRIRRATITPQGNRC